MVFFSFVIVIFSCCYNNLLFFPVVITSCYIFRYAALFNFFQFSVNVIFVYCKPYVYIHVCIYLRYEAEPILNLIIYELHVFFRTKITWKGEGYRSICIRSSFVFILREIIHDTGRFYSYSWSCEPCQSVVFR